MCNQCETTTWCTFIAAHKSNSRKCVPKNLEEFEQEGDVPPNIREEDVVEDEIVLEGDGGSSSDGLSSLTNAASDQKIKETAEHLSQLLKDGCQDKDIPTWKERVSSLVRWDTLLDTLNVIEDRRGRQQVLETTFTRTVVVYEGGVPLVAEGLTKVPLHRTYTDPEDTLFNQILRRSPPKNIQDELEKISPAYFWSRKLHDMLEKIERSWDPIDSILQDIREMEIALKREKIKKILEHIQKSHEQSDWQEVENDLKDIRGTKALREEERAIYDIVSTVKRGGSAQDIINRQLSEIHDKQERTLQGDGDIHTLDELRDIFYIRHTWSENTLLMESAHRKPPLPIVKAMLALGPKAISMVDTPLYDWLPVRYTLMYAAIPEVTQLLIPKEEDYGYFKYPVDEDESNDRIGVRGDDDEELCRRRAQFFTYGTDLYGSTALHWTAFYDVALETVSTLITLADDFAAKMKEVRNVASQLPYEIAVEKEKDIGFVKMLLPPGFGINEFESERLRSLVGKKSKFPPIQRDVSYFANVLPKRRDLRKIMDERSQETLPTLILMLDFYAALFLVITFRQCVEYLLQDGHDGNTSPPGWWYGLIVTLAFMAWRELFQMSSRPAFYFFTVWNYIELAIVGTLGAAAWLMMLEGVDIRDNNSLIVTASFFSWFNIIIFLRNTILSFAIFVSGMQKIVVGLIPFVVVSGLILMGFAEMFWAQSWLVGNCGANEADDEKFCSYWGAVLTTYSFFVGGIEVRDESVDENNKWADFTVIAALFGFVVAIVLLNVVIAIVSDLWEEATAIGTTVFWENRLEFFYDLIIYEKALSKRGGDFDGKVAVKRTLLGKVVFLAEEIVKRSDTTADKLVKCLWVRADYWASFDGLTVRMLSKDYGGFWWQFEYDWRQARMDGDSKRQFVMLVKSAILLILFAGYLLFWFALGLVTGGMLWSPEIRRFLWGEYYTQGEVETENQNQKDEEEIDVLRTKLQKQLEENMDLMRINNRLMEENAELKKSEEAAE